MKNSPKYEYLACRYLHRQIKKLNKQIRCVRSGDDIEYVHQARVASRRLRQGLDVFSDCFGADKSRKWASKIKGLTKGLGNARDKDVQIDLLKKHIDSVSEDMSEIRSSIENILMLFKSVRKSFDCEIRETLCSFEKSKIPEQIESYTAKRLKKVEEFKNSACDWFTFEKFEDKIKSRIDKLIEYRDCLNDPDAANEHHKMRIAAKKLRYTLEIAGPRYDGGLDFYIDTVKQIQKLLGDIHDSDVFCGLLDCLDQRTIDKYADGKTSMEELDAGVCYLKGKFADFKRDRFKSLQSLWSKTCKDNTWKNLSNLIMEMKKVNKSMDTESLQKYQEKLVSVYGLAKSLGFEQEHSEHVTKLALNIFDQLCGEFGLTHTDRLYLECGALLHDIGWADGQSKHHKRSQEMIIDSDLPFSEKDKIIIALIARYHRKALPDDGHRYYCELEDGIKRRVCLLGGILRLADGLDRTHCGVVNKIECDIEKNRIKITIFTDTDAKQELAAGSNKSDLLSLATGNEVILDQNKF